MNRKSPAPHGCQFAQVHGFEDVDAGLDEQPAVDGQRAVAGARADHLGGEGLGAAARICLSTSQWLPDSPGPGAPPTWPR